MPMHLSRISSMYMYLGAVCCAHPISCTSQSPTKMKSFIILAFLSACLARPINDAASTSGQLPGLIAKELPFIIKEAPQVIKAAPKIIKGIEKILPKAGKEATKAASKAAPKAASKAALKAAPKLSNELKKALSKLSHG
jgi:hypothetical protein